MVRKLDLIESKTLRSPKNTFVGTLESAKLSRSRSRSSIFLLAVGELCTMPKLRERPADDQSRKVGGGSTTEAASSFAYRLVFVD
jgi:hypothetical protein